MPICVLVGKHDVNTGNLCEIVGKNGVMQAFSPLKYTTDWHSVTNAH